MDIVIEAQDPVQGAFSFTFSMPADAYKLSDGPDSPVLAAATDWFLGTSTRSEAFRESFGEPDKIVELESDAEPDPQPEPEPEFKVPKKAAKKRR